jgi:hypothetical protein
MQNPDFHDNSTYSFLFSAYQETYLKQYDKASNPTFKRGWRNSCRVYLNELRKSYAQTNDIQTVRFINEVEIWSYEWFFLRPLEIKYPILKRHRIWIDRLRPLCKQFLQALLFESVPKALAIKETALSDILKENNKSLRELLEPWFKDALSDFEPDQDAVALRQVNAVTKPPNWLKRFTGLWVSSKKKQTARDASK